MSFTYFFLIFLALAISGIVAMQVIRSNYVSTTTDSLQRQAEMVSVWMLPLFDPKTNDQTRSDLENNLARVSELSSTRDILVTDSSLNPIYSSQNANYNSLEISNATEIRLALLGKEGSAIRNNVTTDESYLYVAVPIYKNQTVVGVCQIAESLTPLGDLLRLSWEELGGGLLLIAMVAGILGLYFSQRLAAPIEEITRSIQRIAGGELGERIHYYRQDELGEMSDSMNDMANRISEQIEAVTQEKSKLYSILAHMESGVLVIDRNCKINLINPASERMLGVQEKQILAKWHWEALRSYGLSSLIDQVVLSGTPLRDEITLLSANEKVLEVYISPILGQNGATVGAVIVMHDISEFKRLEQMRSEFVANVSHELRTPITAIRGFAETLLDGALTDSELAQQFLRIIYTESDRMARIVHDLLELSKIEHNQSIWRFEKDVDLSEMIRSTVNSLTHAAQSSGIDLRVDSSANEHTLPTLQADPDRIAQVLVNLISNAIHYTPEAGSITVGCVVKEKGIEVWVKDTGMGIPPDDLKRLFERFYRVDKARVRSSGGTGLGLAIVKHIVEAHHGSCSVQSQLGEGSRFAFFLPFHAV